MPNSLFPLPLAAFEEYMLDDDRPSFPMSIIARLRFAGPLDRAAAASALEQVVARHPLLRAKIRKSATGRFEWIAGDDSVPKITWTGDAAHDRLPSIPPIDLLVEPGLRAWGGTDSERSAIILQVHHAACDGKALLQVADDFLRGYARARGGPDCSIEFSPCEPETLHGRGRFGLSPWKFISMIRTHLGGSSRMWNFFTHRPVPILANPNSASADLPASRADVRVGILEAGEVSRLSTLAGEDRVTLNDLLLRDFFLAVDNFRRRHETSATSGWVRAAVPINLREPGDERMPAANLVSMVFLDRKRQHFIDPAHLLKGIHSEMASIRRRRLGLTFIFALWAVRMLPGGLARQVGKERCETTCVLSNYGRALDQSPCRRSEGKIVSGNVILEGIELFSPIRAGTAVAMALVFYAGKLQICLRYDSRLITACQADDLLGTYLSTIRKSLGANRTTLAKATAAD